MKRALFGLIALVMVGCGPTIDSFNKTAADLTHEAIVASENARCTQKAPPCLSQTDFEKANNVLNRISVAGREYTKLRIAGTASSKDVNTFLAVVAEETGVLSRTFPDGVVNKVLQELVKLQAQAAALLGGK